MDKNAHDNGTTGVFTYSGTITGFENFNEKVNISPWSSNPRMKGLKRLSYDETGSLIGQYAVKSKKVLMMNKTKTEIERAHALIGGDLCVTSVRYRAKMQLPSNEEICVRLMHDFEVEYSPEADLHLVNAHKNGVNVQFLGSGGTASVRTIIINGPSEDSVQAMYEEVASYFD